jgi:hypothetical protein
MSRWAVSVARTLDENRIENICRHLKGRDHLEDLGVDGRIISKLHLGD